MGKQHVEIITRGVLVKDGRLLVCRNRKHAHGFLPGGHVEFGERAAAALAREVREEMGIELAVGDFLGSTEGQFTQDDPTSQKGPRRHHEINLIFTLTDDHNALPIGKAPPSIESHILFEWIGLSSIQSGGYTLLPASMGPLVVAWDAARRDGEKPAALWGSDWQ